MKTISQKKSSETEPVKAAKATQKIPKKNKIVALKQIENKKKDIKQKIVKIKSDIRDIKRDEAIIAEAEEPIKKEELIDEKISIPAPMRIAETTSAQPTINNLLTDSVKPEQEELAEAKLKIEALLFASGKSLDEETIASLCEINKRNLRKALMALQKSYDEKENALMIVQDANGWKITVREKYLAIVRKIVADTELAKSVMETLAIIAWKTPIYQSELVKIRGNKCYDHVAELEESGFIIREKKRRSFILKTTEKFYTYFDIDSKNLQGVMQEAKIPSQLTLNQVEEPVEKKEEERKINWEDIQLIRKEIHPEEEQIHRDFLEHIDEKIGGVSLRTEEIASDLPSRQKDAGLIVPGQEKPTEQASAPIIAPVQFDTEDIVPTFPLLEVALPKAAEEDEAKKHKSLTKKQLEKKFKDDLLRVREKMEKVTQKK